MLFLRGLGWRRGFSAAVLLVGIISAAVAAIGPLYARASSESTLTDGLRDAGSGAGLAFTVAQPAYETGAPTAAVRQIGSSGRIPGYGRPILGTSVTATARTSSAEGTTPSTMVWRQDQCAHVVLTGGRCPTAAGEALVPQDAASSPPHWRLGDALTVHLGCVVPDGYADGPVIGHPRIVGTYRPKNFAEPYWFGLPYFKSQLGPAVTSAIKGGADAIFVAPGQFAQIPDGVRGCGFDPHPMAEVDVDVPLVATHVRLNDLPALKANVAAAQKRFPRSVVDPSRSSMRTDLHQALADAARNKHAVETATLVVVLELAALSLLVLFEVVGGAVEARGDEIALAKLRGLPPWRTILFALGEPVALLLAAAPLGFGLAVLVTHALAGGALVSGTPVALTPAVGWAILAALAGGAIAAGLAAVRTLTRPVLEQWRNTAPPRHGTRWLLAVDVVLAVVAIGTVVALRTGSQDRPRAVFLLAPALIVFAVALLGVRILPRLGRLGLRPTRASHRIALFLALRQTVRRPGGLRLAALLAVAAGLATFAVCGEAVAAANRDARAQTEIGTPERLDVLFESHADPQTIVDSVDPHGRWAMAAATWTPDGGPSSGNTIIGPMLAVEAPRLAAAGYAVRGQVPARTIARDIATNTVRPATFTGTALQITLDTTALAGDRPTVLFNVRRQHQPSAQVPAGTLTPGRRTYTARVQCTDGCSLTGITFDRTISAQDTVTGTTAVESVSASGGSSARVAARLDPTAWRSGQIGVGASTRFTADGDALVATFHSTGGSSPVLQYADSPTVLPVVSSPKATANSAARGGVYDFSGASVNYDIVRRASPLPVVLNTGAIVDLDYIRIRLANFDAESAWAVWLGPKAPHDAVARLEKAGLIVQSSHTVHARVAELGRQGPALGLLLLLVCAIAAAVLAVGGTAVALLADSRRRAFELAALRVVGVRHKTLRRSAVVEQALLLGAAIVLGLPSGYVAAAIVLPVVPEFADPTPVVLRYEPPILLALACAAVFVVLLGVTALIAGRALVRSAVPARLREAAR